MATFRVQPAPGAASARAFPRPPRWSFSRAALAILAEWPAVPLRRRIFLGTFATLLLVAALTPGIYPLLVNRSADRMTAVSQDDPRDEPLTEFPAQTSSGPLRTMYPVPVGPAGQSPVAPEKAQALQPPPSVERKQLGAVTGGSDQAAGSVPDRQVSPLPNASVALR